MADMHIIYGRANGNSWGARRLYAGHYPHHRIPLPKLQTKLHERLSDVRWIMESLDQFELPILKLPY